MRPATTLPSHVRTSISAPASASVASLSGSAAAVSVDDQSPRRPCTSTSLQSRNTADPKGHKIDSVEESGRLRVVGALVVSPRAWR